MNSRSPINCTQNPVAQHLATSLLFVCTDIYGDPLDRDYSFHDFAPTDLAKLYTEFQHFLDQIEGRVTEKVGGNWDTLEDFYFGLHPDGCVERDYINSRNYAGVGFWEKERWDEAVGDILNAAAKSQPEICCYVGDDNRIYVA